MDADASTVSIEIMLKLRRTSSKDEQRKMKTIEFHNVDFRADPHPWVAELYGLRKHVFCDRLNWRVSVRDGIELDEFDSENTTYLIGTCEGIPLAGLRLINTLNPYMVEGPFRDFFSCAPPKHALIAESSRFFVDKTRSRTLGLAHLPLTEMLLFSMLDHAERSGLESIVTVVSDAMARIVRHAGWHYQILDSGEASPGETVHLLNMQITGANRQRLLDTIQRKQPLASLQGGRWPLSLQLADMPARQIA
ncbi:acyl-homoserine-lactone synthase [Pantoea sp. Ap-967]|uniref:acyl-homoserine-lactone synthase n=1 Tax=Pantoea sp. Ap-967 TaxID=2608362 RepID=UPI0019633C32|nr:acyl-homoserine-lactone synthase [Pantoea sp. Ap-967]